jgi:hypothetical protein
MEVAEDEIFRDHCFSDNVESTGQRQMSGSNDDDHYFDSVIEILKEELENTGTEPIDIPEGAVVQFLSLQGYSLIKTARKEFYVFALNVRCDDASPPLWKVYRRYSQFLALNNLLCSEQYDLPTLPPKNVLGTFMGARFQDKRKVSPQPFSLVSNRFERTALLFIKRLCAVVRVSRRMSSRSGLPRPLL